MSGFEPNISHEQARLHAEALAASGDLQGAIELASACNRQRRDGLLERQLLRWRQQAFVSVDPTSTPPRWPPPPPPPLINHLGPPEITAVELNSQSLAAGILNHGCILVRGLISPDLASHFAQSIDRAFEAMSSHLDIYDASSTSPWYHRYQLPEDDFISQTRPWVESAAGILLADSPRIAFDFFEMLYDRGIPDIVSNYLGETAALSVAKTTLRRVPATLQLTGWHQDGSFLGADIRSVNLWLSLSDCGEYASGLDLVPKRLEYIVPTGSHGAMLDWAVGEGMVEEVSGDAPVTTPKFRAGDALFFDHLLLHRTGLPPQRRFDRYAIESWFFASSRYPLIQRPLAL